MVPEFLTGLDRWVLWREVSRNGRKTKVPFGVTGAQATDVTDKKNWGTYQFCRGALDRARGAWDGPGIVLGDLGDGEFLIGLDLDSCLTDGDVLADWAWPYLSILNTYAEISPSGTGLKLFMRVRAVEIPLIRSLFSIPGDMNGRKKTHGTADDAHGPAAEIYLSHRYFTVTGNQWHDAPDEVAIIAFGALTRVEKLFGPREITRAGSDTITDATAPDAEALRQKIADTLRERPHIIDRWMGSKAGLADATRSGFDMSLGAMLKAARFTYGEMRAALIANPHGGGSERADDDRYFERIWTRTVVVPRPDPDPPSDDTPPHEHISDPEPFIGVPDVPTEDRPTIQIKGGVLHHLATHGEQAMIQAGMPIFQRGRELVRPVHQEVPASKGRITISAGLTRVTPPGMVDLLCQSANWVRWDGRKKELVPTDPTEKIGNVILSRVGLWNIPVIAGVITTPTLRPDGTVLHQAGYDSVTRLYQVADPTLRPSYIPDAPTKLDAHRAIETLNGLLDEFPFVSDLDRSVALSLLITPVVRGAISVAPLHAIKASTAGTGKSYLADLTSAISTGRPCPTTGMSPDPKETESRLTGLLLGGFPLISLDNVNGELGGDLLCQAVERPTVRLRRLGGSDITEIESRATFLATGNNLRIRGDMTRRTIICNLDAGLERPESRKFNHLPVDDVLADRGKYVAAALIVVRAYVVALFPGKLRPLASFEEWSDFVRSPLVWLGLPDPVDTTEAAREDDPELIALRDLLTTWTEAVGPRAVTVRAAIEIAASRHHSQIGEPTDLAFPDFQEALLSIAGFKGSIDSRRLGNWLRSKEGRIIGGVRFTKGTPDAHSKVATWKAG
jgi:hypothetical protein